MTTFGYALGAGLVLAWEWLRDPRHGPATRRLLAFGSPLTAVVALLLLYNYAHFGSLTEFGLKYQLIGIVGVTLEFQPRLIPVNLDAYPRFTPELIPYFPFLWSRGAGPAGWALDPPFASLLLLSPIIVLAPVALGLLTRRWEHPSPVVRAFVAAGAIGVLATFASLITWIWVAGRFAQDVLPIAVLLGALALWWLVPRQGAQRILQLAHGALVTALVVTSLAWE